MICSRRDFSGAKIGAACPDCQHTNLVHPNLGNPGLSGCMLCQLYALMDMVKDGARITVQPGYEARIQPTGEGFADGSIGHRIEIKRIEDEWPPDRPMAW